MKKTVALLIILSSLFALFACGEKYPAEKSSDEESTVLFTVTADGVEYEVKYELYRALFLAHKSEVDGGDDSVWSDDGKEEYVERINEIIIPKIADIFATIRLAEKIGVDFSSKSVKETVEGFITDSIEGGAYADGIVEGHGSYEKYLEAVKKSGHTYNSHLLLYHYAIAQSEISKYYIGTLNEDNLVPGATPGNLEYTEEDVLAFYESEDCVRVLHAFVPSYIGSERADEIREAMYQATDENAVGLVIVQNTTASGEDGFGGMVIGKHSLAVNHYGELTEAAFSLSLGAVSRVIEISTVWDNGYHVLYRAEKSEEHYEEYYPSVLEAYLNHEIGKLISSLTEQITESIEFTSAYEGLSHGDISID